MANYRPKGKEYMRQLGRKGGVESGKTRWLKHVGKIIRVCAARGSDPLSHAPFNSYPETVCAAWGITGGEFTLEEVAQAMRSKWDYRGGSHDTDWRCPQCHHFTTTQVILCRKCGAFAPANGRLTRARLRELEKEHRNEAILKKHGL